jgi:hypothetical protein
MLQSVNPDLRRDSTTELRWITQLKKTRVRIFAHDPLEATTNLQIGVRIDAFGVAATIF